MEKTFDFDVVIVGAGIGGLTAAALLSKLGHSVCVLERHYVLGGYLQGFEREDFVFDTAIHWLNQCGEDGTVTRLFNFIGEDYPKPQPMKRIKRHLTNHHEFLLTDNPEELKADLLRKFPEDKVGIERFFKDAKDLAAISKRFPELFRSKETMGFWEGLKFGVKRMFIGFPMVKHVFYSGEEGMKKGLGKYFKNPELLELFAAERDLLSCLFPVAWAYNHDFQNPPVGGSQSFVKWLSTKVDDFPNSEVRLSSKVESIEPHEDHVVVHYTNRAKPYSLKAKKVIAACDVELLYKQFLPQTTQGDEVVEKLKSSEMYSSSVTISVALDCPAEELGFDHELIFLSNDSNTRDEHSSGDPHKTAISILAPTTRDKTMSPQDKGVLTLYVPAWMDYENNWKTGVKKNGDLDRNEEYKALKEQYAQIIIDRVSERLCPNLRDHILFLEIATPVTYQRYSQNRGGTMMGTRPGKINMQNKIAHYRTPFKNVVIGGHWAELGGGVPIATKAAYNAALLVLKDLDKNAFDQLVNVMKV